MANKMLIDASHPEETRVVVLRGSKVEEFDFESASKKPLRGNIYLAKVTRVEPSLQAAFIEYGGNRHGFLAFSEIHPDYYQIPVADRQALIEAEAQAERDHEREEERRNRSRRRRPAPKRAETAETVTGEAPAAEAAGEADASVAGDASAIEIASGETQAFEGDAPNGEAGDAPAEAAAREGEPAPRDESADGAATGAAPSEAQAAGTDPEAASDDDADEDDEETSEEETSEEDEDHVEQLGGDALEDVPERPRQHRRQYKIQEVIKRRQILLVQVVKEERGNKGAALTTYLSLAGRYSVLMPNTGRGGGISRKITNAADRKRLKEIARSSRCRKGWASSCARRRLAHQAGDQARLRIPDAHVGERARADAEVLAPGLVYEEGSLIKRAIRDLYNKDIDESWSRARTATARPRTSCACSCRAMPRRPALPRARPALRENRRRGPARRHVLEPRDPEVGGYLVINPTEALVSIDVNSGRSTREHNIEDTALRTNLEASEEIARQLRLRDLAGLIVIDFIDMEEKRNNRAVEKKLNDCLKNDRARIQVGRISPFGLLEMSRQRIRTGVLESSSIPCPHCAGTGFVRSTPSVALHVLRSIEETLIKSAGYNLIVRTRTEAPSTS
jgi:ribonuclease E